MRSRSIEQERSRQMVIQQSAHHRAVPGVPWHAAARALKSRHVQLLLQPATRSPILMLIRSHHFHSSPFHSQLYFCMSSGSPVDDALEYSVLNHKRHRLGQQQQAAQPGSPQSTTSSQTGPAWGAEECEGGVREAAHSEPSRVAEFLMVR